MSTTRRGGGWVGWVTANRTAVLLAVSLATCLTGITLATIRSGDEASSDRRKVAASSDMRATTIPPAAEVGAGDVTTTTAAPGRAGAPTLGRGAARASESQTAARAPVLPGTKPPPPCTPQEVKGTGITKTEITIGQILSDISVTSIQLKTVKEGLDAYLKLVNDAGGVCGRTIKLLYSNDNANPATHDYEAMSHRVFAFVGTFSLIDQIDYETDAPFNPRYQDNGEYVPDVGALALSYNRNQSPVFAGPVGSLSPSLIGGGEFRFFVEEARTKGTPCRKAAVLWNREPTGISEDSANAGAIALAADWGAGLGAGNVKLYSNNLGDPQPVYDQIVANMVADGMNCAFTYEDLGSNVKFVKGLENRGVWPPDRCNGPTCFAVTYMPFSGYDAKFIRDAGDASKFVSTYLPHVPLNESGNPALQVYLRALRAVTSDPQPSSFSILGFTSGAMFVEALQECGGAPTRACLLANLRRMERFTAGGLLAGVTPFRTSRVRCNGDCGSFQGRGTYDWKWVFNCSVVLRVLDRDGRRDFLRVHPRDGFSCGELRVARGTPA